MDTCSCLFTWGCLGWVGKALGWSVSVSLIGSGHTTGSRYLWFNIFFQPMPSSLFIMYTGIASRSFLMTIYTSCSNMSWILPLPLSSSIWTGITHIFLLVIPLYLGYTSYLAPHGSKSVSFLQQYTCVVTIVNVVCPFHHRINYSVNREIRVLFMHKVL